MLNPKISLSNLLLILQSQLRGEPWLSFEPETIMSHLGESDPFLIEKIRILQALCLDVNAALAYPELVLWSTAVANGEPAEFERIMVPSALELAWAIFEFRKVTELMGQRWAPTPELIDVVAYVLVEDGFSSPLAPFDFVPQDRLTPGQQPMDTDMKIKAIQTYITHMLEVSHA